MDILGERPVFDLCNAHWPILTDHCDAPPSSLIRAHVDHSVVGQGSRIVGAEISRSVIGRDITIEQGVSLDECIILDGAVVGAKSRLRRVIVDRFNHIPEGTSIGFDVAADRKRFHVGRSGLVVLPQWHTTDQASLYRHPTLH
jgi:glucose-1-phosphate adenylyltransferase